MNKVQAAIDRIKIASKIAERHGEKLIVCFSGGKDSQVMLDLVKRSGVPFRAVYNVTTIDHPLNVNFIRTHYPEVEFIHPQMNFWELCKKKKALPTIKMRFCCSLLKEYYGGFIRAIGCRREESNKRSKYIVFGKDRKAFRFYPIIDFTELDIWEYIEENGLPVNPCYEFGTRVGCMICPFASPKQIQARFNEFPRLRIKMLTLIKELRENGYAHNYQNKTDEDLLNWWMSKKNIREYFQPEFDFQQSPIQKK